MTLVCRIASSSEVLPWSTWPITVTTGGRVTSSPSTVFFALFDRRFDVEGDVLDAVAEFARDQGGGIDVEDLVQRGHHAEVHQLLDDLAGLHAHVARQVGDGHALGDPHDALGGFGRGDLGLALLLAGHCAALLRHRASRASRARPRNRSYPF